MQCNTDRVVRSKGSVKQSRNLPTYHSPNSSLTLHFYLDQNVGLRKGYLASSPESRKNIATDIHLTRLNTVFVISLLFALATIKNAS